MDKKTLYWLQDQLLIWQQKGWVTTENAKSIKSFYKTIESRQGPSLARLLIIGLGAILIALGTFLLFAGHWYSFSPNGRFDWIMFWLILTVSVVGLAIWKVPPSSRLAECITVFYMAVLSFGTFLMGDTYYIGSSAGFYLLIILGLSLPIIYLLDSGVGMILYILGSMWWCLSVEALNFWIGPGGVWGFLLLGIPFYIRRLQHRSDNFYTVLWLSWAYVASLFGVSFFTIKFYQPILEIFFIAVLSSATYGVGVLSKEKGLWSLPFRGIGGLGLLYVVLMGSFLTTWDQIRIFPMQWGGIILIVSCLLVPCYMSLLLGQRKYFVSMLVTLSPAVVATCYFMAYSSVSSLAISLFFNLFIALLGILLFLRGTLEKNVGLVNGGITTLFVLVVARFVDPSFSFVERGILFILVGIAIITTNAVYMWNKARKVQKMQRGARRDRMVTKQAELTKDALSTNEKAVSKDELLPKEEPVDAESTPLEAEAPSEEGKVNKGGDHDGI